MTPSSSPAIGGSVSSVSSTVDAVEAWVAGQSFWLQAPILLGVLIPLTYWLAGLIDKLVDRLLWPSTRREARRQGAHPAGHALAVAPPGDDPAQSDAR